MKLMPNPVVTITAEKIFLKLLSQLAICGIFKSQQFYYVNYPGNNN